VDAWIEKERYMYVYTYSYINTYIHPDIYVDTYTYKYIYIHSTTSAPLLPCEITEGPESIGLHGGVVVFEDQEQGLDATPITHQLTTLLILPNIT
jgi:hypothetical protein